MARRNGLVENVWAGRGGYARAVVSSVVVTLIVAGLGSDGYAQDSRAEVIADAQAQKSERLSVEGPGAVEKGFLWVLRSPLLAGTGGVYPWFGSAYRGTGTAIGVGYLRRMPRRSRLNFVAAAAGGGSTILDVSARLPELGSGLLSVTVGARRTEAKELGFFGLGLDSTEDEALEYDYQPTQIGLDLTLRPVEWLQLAGGYQRLDLTTRAEPAGMPRDAPGLGVDLGYDVARLGGTVDWRPDAGYSTRGGLIRATWIRHQESRDRPYSFETIEYEIVQHVPLLQEQFGIAIRALMTATMAKEGERVPFVLTPYLGGGETLRGFDNRRFTDLNRLLLTAEYRWRPSRFLDMAVFMDAGKVTPRRGELNFENLQTSWGIGARFHGPSFTALRAEIARSREGWQVIIAGSQVF